jgi:hypothetical protein
MSVLRGFFVVIVTILLFLSILFSGVTATLVLSLKYDNVQPKMNTIVRNIIEPQIGEDQMVNQLIPYLKVYCNTNTNITQSFQGYTFVFPCSVVKDGYYSIINYSVNYLVGDFYYKEYNCSFVQCFQESQVPLFLVSNHARDIWKYILFRLLIISVFLSLVTIFLVEKKSSAPTLIGSLLIIDSLIVLSLEKIGTFVARMILSPISLALTKENTNSVLAQVVAMFFSESSKVFLWMFIAGVVFILAGILIRITGLGFKIQSKIDEMRGKSSSESEEVSKSDVRSIVREEIKKSKPKKKK